jgi:hypothetical protein
MGGAVTIQAGTFNQDSASLTFSSTFSQSAGTFQGGSASINMNGAFTVSGGTFVSTSGTMSVVGDWDTSAVDFNDNGGTVVFSGSKGSGKTINVNGTETFINFTFNDSGGYIGSLSANDNIIVNGTLTLTNGGLNATAGYGIQAKGDVVVASTYDGGNAQLTFNGTTSQTFDLTGATARYDGNIIINGASTDVTLLSDCILNASGQDFTLTNGILNLSSYELEVVDVFTLTDGTLNGNSGTLDLVTVNLNGGTLNATTGTTYVGGTWTNGGGSFEHNNGTFVIDGNTGGARTFTFGNNETFNNFTLQGDAGWTHTLAVNQSIIVVGILTLINDGLNASAGYGIEAQGNVSVSSTYDGGNARLTFGSNATQTFDLTGATDKYDGDIVVNKTGGAVNLASALTMNASNQDLIITAGTFDLSNNTLIVNGSGSTFTVASGANLQLQGGESVTGTPTLSSGSSVTYDGAAGPYTMKDWTYTNATLVINGGASSVFTLGATETFTNTTITSGILSLGAYNITVSSTFSNDATLRTRGNNTFTGTMDSNSGTVEFTGDGDAGADIYSVTSTSTSYYNLTINSTDGATDIFELGAAIDINGDFTLTAGTFDVAVPNYAMTVGDDWSNTGTFTQRSGTVTFDDSTQTTVISGSTTFNNLTCTTQDKNIQFTNSTTQTISGTLTLTGAASHLIILRSTSDGSYWNLIAGASQAVTYVNVKDSDASGGTIIDPGLNSTDSGHNLNWQFQPIVNWTSASQNGAESVGSFTLTAQLSYAYGMDVTIPYTYATGTATLTSDYTITASPLVITAGNTTGNITITVIDDVIDELEETVIVIMGNPTNGIKGSTDTHTASIGDNDAAPTISINDPTVSEGAGTGTVTVTLTGGSYLGVTVDYTTSSGTAIEGTDFTDSTGTLTWAADETGTKTFNVTITNDTLDENDETANLTLSNPVNATFTDSAGVLTIQDNDAPPVVTVTSASQSKAESAGTATITVQLSTASGLNVSIPFTTSGTATGSGTDYSITATPVSISAGSTTTTITYTIIDDALDENSETAIVTLGSPTNGTLGTDVEHTLTITDNDDPPTVQWTASSQSGAESVGTMTITAQLSAVSGLNVTVPYTMTGTATGSGTDYSITASPVTISAGSTTTTVTITIIDDALDEDNETVIVTIGAPTNATKGATDVHTATINDNDATPTITFSSGTASGSEATTPVAFVATLSAVSGRTITVDYATANGTATAVSDYTAASGTLTFTAGQTEKTTNVIIVNDALDENDETFTFTLSNLSNVDAGANIAVTYTIEDDDATPTVQWTASSQSGAESVGTMTITAQLSAVSGLNVTVPYTMTGTATGSGTDYSITASPVTINAGSSTTNITITVVDDSLDENNETVIVTMGSPTNATKGATDVHTATINDNDDPPTVQWTTASQSVVENAETITITAQLSGASSFTITVPFTVSGTAIGSGVDYTIDSSPVTIPAGETTTNISLTIVEEIVVEPTETVIITMGTPTNATKGTTDIHIASITNDDAPRNSSSDSSTAAPSSTISSGNTETTTTTTNSTNSGTSTCSGLTAGSRVKLVWTATSSVNLVNLYYSINEGDTYTKIVGPISNTESYSWAIPSNLEDDSTIQFKIEGTDLATITSSYETDSMNVCAEDEDNADNSTDDEETTDNDDNDSGTDNNSQTSDSEEEDIVVPIGMALESVFGDKWAEDAEDRNTDTSSFPTREVAIGSLIKLPDDGDINTQVDSAVYYIGADHRRHPFPNESVYKTWFTGFYGIKEVDQDTMSNIPMGPMITYRPGSTLVKFPSVNKVYVVDGNGNLRWIASEDLAILLYGTTWNKFVLDISEAFYTSYTFGNDLLSITDMTWDTVMAVYGR